MKTYILFWNPAISSYKLEDFQREIDDYENADMNWGVWEYEKACAGDRFFMVRCGSGKTGICMSGYFSSDPWAQWGQAPLRPCSTPLTRYRSLK